MKRILKKTGIVLLIIIVFVTAGAGILLNYPAILAQHKIAEIKDYAVSVSEIIFPQNAAIVGLGEASHGNVEFQEMKLSVLKNLVENYGFTAFGLEMDFGDSLSLNEYIQDGEGDPKELLKETVFPIYHTDQMTELLEWMHDYNLKVVQ